MSAKSPEKGLGNPGSQLRTGAEPLESIIDEQPAPPSVAQSLPPRRTPEQPLTIKVDQARDKWDSRGNYPKTGAQNRRDIGGALLTGEDIEQIEVDATRRILASRGRREPRKLPTIGDGIQQPAAASELKVPRGYHPTEAARAASREAIRKALEDRPPPEAA